MIDIDVARRLQDAGLPWEPADGDLFAIDTEQLRDEAFMLSSMVIESGRGAFRADRSSASTAPRNGHWTPWSSTRRSGSPARTSCATRSARTSARCGASRTAASSSPLSATPGARSSEVRAPARGGRLRRRPADAGSPQSCPRDAPEPGHPRDLRATQSPLADKKGRPSPWEDRPFSDSSCGHEDRWITWRARGSPTRRHRLEAEVGRVSMMRTRSPIPAVFSSSWALNLLVLVVTLP